MNMKRALVLVAIVATAVAGLPVRVAAAPHCRGCCDEMAACCEMAAAPPATPATTSDRTGVTPQPATGQAVQALVHAGPCRPAPYRRIEDGCPYHLRCVVLRI
jgi:hypothetical protein